jgi:hypothetical protein
MTRACCTAGGRAPPGARRPGAAGCRGANLRLLRDSYARPALRGSAGFLNFREYQ